MNLHLDSVLSEGLKHLRIVDLSLGCQQLMTTDVVLIYKDLRSYNHFTKMLVLDKALPCIANSVKL